ncbi:hypothetical protein KCU98_g4379, partial [Aureobasidium melanogenum]
MSRSSHPSELIEEIDLSAAPEPRVAPNQLRNRHFDVQLYVLNHQQSRKNSSTVWHRDTDGSLRATEWTSRFMYRQDRKSYLDRDGQVDQEWADEKWQQWSERDFHPAVEAYNGYNEPAPEMIVLEDVKEHLQGVDDALKNVWAILSQAQTTLGLSIHPLGLHDSDHRLAQTKDTLKDIFEDMDAQLRIVNEAQRQSEKQMKSLGLAVKALIRARTVAEKTRKKREANDEKMVDTVKFLKECLNNHCRLVNMVLERPGPLVQQGTDLIQAMLSEMFGLPTDESIAQDLEPELEPILEEEAEEESGAEIIWEKTETEDVINVDQDSESEPKFDMTDNNAVRKPDMLLSGTKSKSRRLLQREKHEKAKAILYQRFGLSIISEPSTDQKKAVEQRRNNFKRQKTMIEKLCESPERSSSPIKKLPVLRQTTLSFNKVRKNRRLFSRRELSQMVTTKHQEEEEEEEEGEEEEEETEIASPGSVRRNPRRATNKHADYRDNFQAWNKKMFGSDGLY